MLVCQHMWAGICTYVSMRFLGSSRVVLGPRKGVGDSAAPALGLEFPPQCVGRKLSCLGFIGFRVHMGGGVGEPRTGI